VVLGTADLALKRQAIQISSFQDEKAGYHCAMRVSLIATLYSMGKLSERQAREALGMTRRAFEEMLPRFGFSILVDTSQNLETELNACLTS